MAGTTDTTVDKMTAWRIEQFEALGFGREDAEYMAVTRNLEGWMIPVDDVRKLIRSGCPVGLAKQIIL
jgi:hypothetical protein